MITEKQMKTLGFAKSRRNNAYTHPLIWDEIHLSNYDTISDVIRKVFEQGRELGKREGEGEFQKKLREMLGIS